MKRLFRFYSSFLLFSGVVFVHSSFCLVMPSADSYLSDVTNQTNVIPDDGQFRLNVNFRADAPGFNRVEFNQLQSYSSGADKEDIFDNIETQVKQSEDLIRPVLIAFALSQFKKFFEQAYQESEVILDSFGEQLTHLKKGSSTIDLDIIDMLYGEIEDCIGSVQSLVIDGFYVIHDSFDQKDFSFENFVRITSIARSVKKNLEQCLIVTSDFA